MEKKYAQMEPRHIEIKGEPKIETHTSLAKTRANRNQARSNQRTLMLNNWVINRKFMKKSFFIFLEVSWTKTTCSLAALVDQHSHLSIRTKGLKTPTGITSLVKSSTNNLPIRKIQSKPYFHNSNHWNRWFTKTKRKFQTQWRWGSTPSLN